MLWCLGDYSCILFLHSGDIHDGIVRIARHRVHFNAKWLFALMERDPLPSVREFQSTDEEAMLLSKAKKDKREWHFVC